jgi:hypothetical protein
MLMSRLAEAAAGSEPPPPALPEGVKTGGGSRDNCAGRRVAVGLGVFVRAGVAVAGTDDAV